MKNTYFKLVRSGYESKSKVTINESMNLIALLTEAVKVLMSGDQSLKSLLIVNNRGVVKYYWKRLSQNDEKLTLVESIHG